MQELVREMLGQRFIEPQTSDLSMVYKEARPNTPLVFVLSTGTDPAADLYKLADKVSYLRHTDSLLPSGTTSLCSYQERALSITNMINQYVPN